jgi:beta-aspartyl-peptidase (threonine type)
VLEAGGSAVDAAQIAVRVLEDDEVFNAGVGGAVDESGLVMTDAAIFRGDDLGYGACGAVAGIRNPVDLARAILDDGKHCLLVGPGALDFARKKGVRLVDPRALEVDPSKARWWYASASDGPPLEPEVGDTVGAVALDLQGSIAAATSTGGLLGKYAGRVGDSPIAGAGTYARNDWGGISATGHGETILKTVLGFQALQDLRLRAAEAPATVLFEALEQARAQVGGRGGLIAIRPSGQAAWARNTPHMGVAWIRRGGAVESTF